MNHISDKNILKIHELYEDDFNYYVVSEFLKGGSLASRLKSGAKFNEEEIKIIIK